MPEMGRPEAGSDLDRVAVNKLVMLIFSIITTKISLPDLNFRTEVALACALPLALQKLADAGFDMSEFTMLSLSIAMQSLGSENGIEETADHAANLAVANIALESVGWITVESSDSEEEENVT